MEFKPGDKLVCIDNTVIPNLDKQSIYEFVEYDKRFKGEEGKLIRILIEEKDYFYYARRFRLATKTEQILYGNSNG